LDYPEADTGGANGFIHLGLGFLLGNEDGKEKGPEKIKLLERI
jgi:hypothetical protein